MFLITFIILVCLEIWLVTIPTYKKNLKNNGLYTKQLYNSIGSLFLLIIVSFIILIVGNFLPLPFFNIIGSVLLIAFWVIGLREVLKSLWKR